MFVDSDDYIDCNAVELLVEKAKEKNPDFVIYGYHYVRQQGKKLKNKYYEYRRIS